MNVISQSEFLTLSKWVPDPTNWFLDPAEVHSWPFQSGCLMHWFGFLLKLNLIPDPLIVGSWPHQIRFLNSPRLVPYPTKLGSRPNQSGFLTLLKWVSDHAKWILDNTATGSLPYQIGFLMIMPKLIPSPAKMGYWSRQIGILTLRKWVPDPTKVDTWL